MPPTGELLPGNGDLVLEPKIPVAGPLLGNGDLDTLTSTPLLLLGPLLRGAVVPLLTVDDDCTVTGGASLWWWDSAVMTVGHSGDGDCVTYTAHDAQTSRKREKRSKIQNQPKRITTQQSIKPSEINFPPLHNPNGVCDCDEDFEINSHCCQGNLISEKDPIVLFDVFFVRDF